MSLRVGDNLLKGLSLLAIIMAKLVISNLAVSNLNSVSIKMILSILGIFMRGCAP
jgi:hypothetical protein